MFLDILDLNKNETVTQNLLVIKTNQMCSYLWLKAFMYLLSRKRKNIWFEKKMKEKQYRLIFIILRIHGYSVFFSTRIPLYYCFNFLSFLVRLRTLKFLVKINFKEKTYSSIISFFFLSWKMLTFSLARQIT